MERAYFYVKRGPFAQETIEHISKKIVKNIWQSIIQAFLV